jgi:hypothetical protein
METTEETNPGDYEHLSVLVPAERRRKRRRRRRRRRGRQRFNV